ncbi:MAG: hypothetical protein HYR67_06130 [Bacteroidetes bacterium]|nr:hypothetical protein [Bacteroidota bacterium]
MRNNTQVHNNARNYMSNVKNAASFSRLVDFCTGYGDTYNPGRPTLQIEALITQRQKVNSTLANTIGAKSLYDNEVNQRKQVFDQLPKLVSSILRTLEASGASPEKLNDARAFARQITGFKSKSRAPVSATTAAAQSPDTPMAKPHSTLQLAYASKADAFAKLVNAISTEPLYFANETVLSKSGLNDKLNQLTAHNQRVSEAHVSWSNIRIDRNQTMYDQSMSMYNMGRAVKKYVRAIFGLGSEQYAQIKSLSFTKPNH